MFGYKLAVALAKLDDAAVPKSSQEQNLISDLILDCIKALWLYKEFVYDLEIRALLCSPCSLLSRRSIFSKTVLGSSVDTLR
jgi:hypothetical protein